MIDTIIPITHHVTFEQWEKFTPTDHNTWKILFEKQIKLLQNRAVTEAVEGMEKLRICSDRIPQISELTTILKDKTGFTLIPVTGFISEELFFKFLSERRFPTICSMRPSDQIDFALEPDIFHDVFGHIPLLVNLIFSDLMQAMGMTYVNSNQPGIKPFIKALYLFTIEFGLIKTPIGPRIYGAGILSSNQETIYCLESPIPLRKEFNINEIISTQFFFDALQTTYFIIENFEQLFKVINNLESEYKKILHLVG